MTAKSSTAFPAASPPLVMGRAEWAMLGFLAFIWGGSFFFIGVAIKEVPFFTIAAFRVVLAGLVLHLILRLQGEKFPLSPAILWAFLVMGLLNNAIPFSLLTFGQSRIESGLASILNATTPIFAMLVAHVFSRDDRIDARKAIGILLGFAGVVVLFGGKELVTSSALIGQAACILASVSYGFAGTFGRRFGLMRVPPLTVAAGQLTGSSLLLVPVALIYDQPWALPLPSAPATGALLALALVSTAGAYVLFFGLLARAGSTNTSLVTLLVPCSAILLGRFVLGEALGPYELGGFAIIALGLLVIDGRLVRMPSRRD